MWFYRPIDGVLLVPGAAASGGDGAAANRTLSAARSDGHLVSHNVLFQAGRNKEIVPVSIFAYLLHSVCILLAILFFW